MVYLRNVTDCDCDHKNNKRPYGNVFCNCSAQNWMLNPSNGNKLDMTLKLVMHMHSTHTQTNSSAPRNDESFDSSTSLEGKKNVKPNAIFKVEIIKIGSITNWFCTTSI